MPKRSRKSTGRRTKSSSKRRSRRGTASRREPTAETAVRQRRSDRHLPSASELRRTPLRSRTERDTMPVRARDRRNRLRPSKRARRRLSHLGLSLRRPNENASDNQTALRVCTRKKETRRAVIIATGHGGINGQRNYRRRKSCRS